MPSSTQFESDTDTSPLGALPFETPEDALQSLAPEQPVGLEQITPEQQPADLGSAQPETSPAPLGQAEPEEEIEYYRISTVDPYGDLARRIQTDHHLKNAVMGLGSRKLLRELREMQDRLDGQAATISEFQRRESEREFKSLPQEEFLQKLQNDPQFRARVGQQLVVEQQRAQTQQAPQLSPIEREIVHDINDALQTATARGVTQDRIGEYREWLTSAAQRGVPLHRMLDAIRSQITEDLQITYQSLASSVQQVKQQRQQRNVPAAAPMFESQPPVNAQGIPNHLMAPIDPQVVANAQLTAAAPVTVMGNQNLSRFSPDTSTRGPIATGQRGVRQDQWDSLQPEQMESMLAGWGVTSPSEAYRQGFIQT